MEMTEMEDKAQHTRDLQLAPRDRLRAFVLLAFTIAGIYVCFRLLLPFLPADALGHHSIATAALIAFFWLQREEDIFLRLAWSHYRPSEARNFARIFHHKTGELVDVPLTMMTARIFGLI
jgi:hypothetical protein